MPTVRQCPGCEAALPADAPQGLCPWCLMAAALAPMPAAAGQPTVRMEADADEEPSQRIDRYKILQKLGEGGCGVVYMAEQTEPVRRKVALKVIKMGMDTQQVIARFEAERQALALMDHPNIAKVLDAGTTDKGRPYFVMELVKGIRITDYCDQHHLPASDRLGLFMQVCQAIQHAHQKGIIHRDIKPSNILVTLHDGVPVPKVIDFGIAKATEQPLTTKTVFTAFGQFMGTPAYMSPEQAELSGLDIDTRSDIYALGVLLYELLTGRTPLEARELVQAGLDEIRRRIREEEPVRPSTRLSTMLAADLTEVAQQRQSEPAKLARFIRGDLDWIVMKCLEKDRTRRYETANGLAMDLRRHLNNEPVLACPPSTIYRVQKLMRRNKLAFAAGTAIAVMLVLGIAASLWQARRALRAEAVAKERLAESQAVSKFMIGVFQSPDPARNGRTITVAETLDRAVRNLNDDLSTQPAVRAKLQATLGRTYFSLGLCREGIPLQEKARDYYLKTFGLEHTNTISAGNNLANLYDFAGRLEDALKLREEVLRLRRKLLDPEHPDTLMAMNNLAQSYFDAGRREESLRLREEVLQLERKVNGPEHPDTLLAMSGLATSYRAVGRLGDALKLCEEVLKLERKVNGPEHPDTLLAMSGLGQSYFHGGNKEEAIRLLDQVVAIRRKVLGPDHPDTLMAMHDLAITYFAAGRKDEALRLREEVLGLRRKVLGPDHLDTLIAMDALGQSCVDAGRRAEALKLYEELLTLRRKVLGPERPETIGAMHNLATSYFDAGRKDQALELREEVLQFGRKVNGPEHPETLKAMQNLVISYFDAGRKDEALKLCEEMLTLERKVNGPEHHETLWAMQKLAVSYFAAGRKDEALKVCEEVLTIKRKVLPPEHPDTLLAMHNLAVSYFDAGRKEEALKLLEEVLPLRRKVSGPEHPDTVGAMEALAQSYSDADRMGDAVKLHEEVLAFRRKVFGPAHPDTAASLNALAWLLATSESAEVRNGTKAVQLAEEAVTATSRKDPGYLDTLAAAYAEAQQFDKAAALEREAIALFRDEPQKKEADVHLRLYQGHKPYHEKKQP